MWSTAEVVYSMLPSMVQKLLVEVLVCVIAFAVGDYFLGRNMFSAKSKKKAVARKVFGTAMRPASTVAPRSARLVADQRRVQGLKRLGPSKGAPDPYAHEECLEEDLSVHAVAEDPPRLQEISAAIDDENLQVAMGLMAQQASKRTDARLESGEEELSLKLVQLACKQGALDAALTMLEASQVPLMPAMSEVLVEECIAQNSRPLTSRLMRLRAKCPAFIDSRAYRRLVSGLAGRDEAPGSSPGASDSEARRGICEPPAANAPVQSAPPTDPQVAADLSQAWEAVFGPLLGAAAVAAARGSPLPQSVATVLDQAPVLSEAVSKIRTNAHQKAACASPRGASTILASIAAAQSKQAHAKVPKVSGAIRFSATPGQPRLCRAAAPASVSAEGGEEHVAGPQAIAQSQMAYSDEPDRSREDMQRSHAFSRHRQTGSGCLSQKSTSAYTRDSCGWGYDSRQRSWRY